MPSAALTQGGSGGQGPTHWGAGSARGFGGRPHRGWADRSVNVGRGSDIRAGARWWGERPDAGLPGPGMREVSVRSSNFESTTPTVITGTRIAHRITRSSSSSPAEPPSSLNVRRSTDWQTGHRADSLAVFCMVATETEVAEQRKNAPDDQSEAWALDLDGCPLAGCAARQVGKSPRGGNVQFSIFVVKRID